MKIKTLAMTLCLVLPQVVWADEDDHKHHVGHSDALLFLLQHKIAITKLQTKFVQLASSKQGSNLKAQGRRLQKAMPILQQYLATPESRYPNMEIYHQSLQSRGALLQDFTALLVTFQQQSSNN